MTDAESTPPAKGQDLSNWEAITAAITILGVSDYYWPVATHPSLFSRLVLSALLLGVLAAISWIALSIWNLHIRPWRPPGRDVMSVAVIALAILACVGSWPNLQAPERSEVKALRIERKAQFESLPR